MNGRKERKRRKKEVNPGTDPGTDDTRLVVRRVAPRMTGGTGTNHRDTEGTEMTHRIQSSIRPFSLCSLGLRGEKTKPNFNERHRETKRTETIE